MSKEFNLSERIKQLEKELRENAKLTEGQIDGIIRMILFMDKEFIKKLKSESTTMAFLMHNERQELSKVIDKLAGFSNDDNSPSGIELPRGSLLNKRKKGTNSQFFSNLKDSDKEPSSHADGSDNQKGCRKDMDVQDEVGRDMFCGDWYEGEIMLCPECQGDKK